MRHELNPHANGDDVPLPSEPLPSPAPLTFAPDGYVVTDRAGVIFQANHAASALLGCRLDFLIGKPLAVFIAVADRPAFYRLLVRFAASRRDVAHQWEARLHRRRARPVVCSFILSHQDDGPERPAGLRWVLRDITSRKVAEHALQQQQALADSLIEAAQAAILVLDAAGRIVRSNPFVHHVTGLPAEELRGRYWATLLPEPERGATEARLRECQAQGVVRTWTGGLLCAAAPPRAVAWSLKPVGLDGDAPAALLALGHDITDLKRAQEQALHAERLAAIGQMTAGITHESRNALQRATSCLERLRWRMQERPEELDLLGRARRAMDELTLLYEDVRSYAAPMVLDLAPCHLGDIWREAWAQVRADHPGKDARLSEDECGLDMWISADCYRIGQVFRNLFDNALAACPGPAEIAIACATANLDHRPAVRVAVRDNGPGIPPELRDRVFEPFFTTKPKGSGLGMAIATRIIDAHGGQITIGSAAGGGAEVAVTLPRSPSS